MACPGASGSGIARQSGQCAFGCGAVRCVQDVKATQSRLGEECPGLSRLGMLWQRKAVVVRSVLVRQCVATQVKAVRAGCAGFCSGGSRQRKSRQSRYGTAGCGWSCRVIARQSRSGVDGTSRLVLVRYCKAVVKSLGWLGWAAQVMAARGSRGSARRAFLGSAAQGSQGLARHDLSGYVPATQRNAVKARRGKSGRVMSCSGSATQSRSGPDGHVGVW